MNDSNKYKCGEIFAHVRESKCKLTSNVLVENVLLDNKDIFAIGTLFNDLKDLNFNGYNEQFQYSLEASDLFDKMGVFDAFYANIDYHHKQSAGYHLGDCTSFAMSCSRCISESKYIDGLNALDEFNTFLNNKNIICLEPSIKLLSVLFCTEQQWFQYKTQTPCVTTDYSIINNELDELWDKLWNWEYHYNCWNNSSLEQKELCHKRAIRFLNYFHNRPTNIKK